MAYQITMAPYMLYSLGVNYHATGVLRDKETRAKLFDYYVCDEIDERQRTVLRRWCKDVRFLGIAGEYAPELSKPVVAFPKRAFYLHRGTNPLCGGV